MVVVVVFCVFGGNCVFCVVVCGGVDVWCCDVVYGVVFVVVWC